VARTRRYRSSWLLGPAVAISATAQGAAILAYEHSRTPPKPYLTIHLGEGGSSWDYDVGEKPADSTTIAIGAPAGFKVSVEAGPAPWRWRWQAWALGEQKGVGPTRFALPDQDDTVFVSVTAPDGAQWGKTIEVHAKQETDVGVEFTKSRGQVLVTKIGDASPALRCSQERCGIEIAPGTQVKLTAVLGEDSTFGGYSQYPMRTPRELVPYLGDPLASCVAKDAIAAAAAGNVLECAFTIGTDTEVAADFGLQPKEVNVAIEKPRIEDMVKPMSPPPKVPPPPIEAEKLDEKPMEVAIAPIKPPPKLPPPIPPPPPPPQEQKPKTPPPPPPPNMVMVEVKDDKHVKDKAPDDAKQLSDKNRDVEAETRATQTNLDKESEGKQVASKENDDKMSEQVGGPDDKIRQLEDTKATTNEHLKETDHSGNKEIATGVKKGEEGDNGENGTGAKDPGILAMRGIEGRGNVTDQTDGKKAGKRGTPGLNTPLAFKDYERLMGKDKVDEERQVAARKMSSKKGRWERKLDAIKSSLENFIPDVRPGNQTALKTRAHPFALYIARMHRRIHELWGFGFLEDLDGKPADYPLNDPNLWVNLEMSVNADGTVHKVTIAKTSGKTEFDVAAVDTVISAGPYEPTPEAIRSVDGRIYLRWGFYRNWRQCGTFNVEPYILTSVPEDNGVGVLDDGAMVKNIGKMPKITGRRHPTGDKTVTPDDGLAKQKVSPDSNVTDKQAVFAANVWVSAFATAEVDKLVKLSTVPFYAGGKIAANTTAELKDMYSGLVVESGSMRDWKLLAPGEYAGGGTQLPEGNVVVQVRTTKESFAVVLSRTKSGEYRASQLAR
jgi:TonB family protein